MVEIVNEINPDYPLQKFDFNHCKSSLPTFFKEHLSTITDCNEQVSPPTFLWFSKYHIKKRINKNRAHYNLKAKLL
jgi:hypothetical protein